MKTNQTQLKEYLPYIRDITYFVMIIVTVLFSNKELDDSTREHIRNAVQAIQRENYELHVGHSCPPSAGPTSDQPKP